MPDLFMAVFELGFGISAHNNFLDDCPNCPRMDRNNSLSDWDGVMKSPVDLRTCQIHQQTVTSSGT
jgi:hypothetical protein